MPETSPPKPEPQTETRVRNERLFDAFEAAWRRGDRPVIDDFLPTGAEHRDVLIELIRLDLEWRYKAGEAARIESYLARYPDLGHGETLLALVSREYELRNRHDPGLTVDEFITRFPAITDEINKQPTRLAADARPKDPEWIRTGAEPVAGYRLIRFLGRGGFGQVWEATGPGDLRVAFKFVNLDASKGAVELQALRVIKDIKHPNLHFMFGTWDRDDWLLIGMELADGTLSDRHKDAVNKGLTGIKQAELLKYVRETAKVLDYLNKPRHFLGGTRPVGIQHADIKPQNILLVGGGVKVGDFGLVRLLDRPIVNCMGGLTVHYAAPECFLGQTSRWSDQYSLAVTYYFLRTNTLPFKRRLDNTQASPDLSAFPEAERPALARAFAVNPRERWPNCRTFVQALGVKQPPEVSPPPAPTSVPTRETTVSESIATSPPTDPPIQPQEVPPTVPRSVPPTSETSVPEGISTTPPTVQPTITSGSRPKRAYPIPTGDYRIGDEPVPHYVLERKLGTGGIGEVWEAKGIEGSRIALKFVNLEHRSGLKELQVMRTLKDLRHPYLIAIIDMWLRDSSGNIVDVQNTRGPLGLLHAVELVIAMELGEKNLLDRLMECQKEGHYGVAPDELLRYMEHAARAIDFLNFPTSESNRPPIQHCDIKPGNILIVAGSAQVSDFGLARVRGGFEASTTQSAGFMSVPYTSPELFWDASKPSQWSDQYSLAITYVELRTGSLPFEHSTPAGVMFAHTQGKLDLSKLSHREQTIIRRATSIDAGKRFPTTTDMVLELRRANEDTVGRTTPHGTWVDDDLQTGMEVAPGYRLIRRIGKGPYGAVWEARAPGGEPIALRVTCNVPPDIHRREEFRSLAVIKRLNHQHLLQVHAYWLLDENNNVIDEEALNLPEARTSTLIIATGLAHTSLQVRLLECQQAGRTGIPTSELFPYMHEAALAIDYLNEPTIRVRHGDVRPENIMLVDGPRVVVKDFGLSALLLTVTNTFGSPVYTAPELILGTTTRWTDQYAFAITYYKLRTGELPFSSHSASGIMLAHVEGKLAFTRVSDLEQAILSRATAVRPADRFPNCCEMISALERALKSDLPLMHGDSSAITEGTQHEIERTHHSDVNARTGPVRQPKDVSPRPRVWRSGTKWTPRTARWLNSLTLGVVLVVIASASAYYPVVGTILFAILAVLGFLWLIRTAWKSWGRSTEIPVDFEDSDRSDTAVDLDDLVCSVIEPSGDSSKGLPGDLLEFNIRTTLFESPAGLELRRMVIRARAEGRELTKEEQQRAQEIIDADARVLDSGAAIVFLQDKLRRSQQVGGQSASIPGRLILTRTLQGHTDSVWSAAFSSDSHAIVSGSLDCTVRLWNVYTGAESGSLRGHAEGVTSIAVSRDGRHALSGSLDGTLRLWDLEKATPLRSVQAHKGKIFAVAFLPDGHQVASAGEDQTARVWNTKGEGVHLFKNHQGWVTCLDVSWDLRYAVSGSEDRTVRIWHSVSGRELLCIQGHTGPVRSVAVSPDGTRILSGSDDGTMRLWDAQTGRELRRFLGHTDWVRSVAFSPDGRYALSGSDDETIRLWEIETGEEVGRGEGHLWSVVTVAFSPDGRYALSGSDDATIRLWEIGT